MRVATIIQMRNQRGARQRFIRRISPVIAAIDVPPEVACDCIAYLTQTAGNRQALSMIKMHK